MPDVTGFRAVSFYNPSTGQVVQIDADQMSGESTFEKSEVEPDQTGPSGDHPYVGDECVLTVESWDWGAFERLAAWQEAGTLVSAVAVGVQRCVQWYERDRIVVQPVPIMGEKGQVQGFRVVMRRVAAHPRVWSQINLLAHLGWEDATGDGVADGYTVSRGAPSFEDETQIVATGGAVTVRLAEPLAFPVQGGRLGLSLIAQPSPEHEGRLIMRADSHSGETVAKSFSSFSRTESRQGSSIPLSAGTYTLSFTLFESTSHTGNLGENKLRYPSLRIGTSVKYLTH